MLILPLASPDATLDTAGGKGANLARLVRAGFPVPPGFIIATGAYRAFLAANALEPIIQAALEHVLAEDAGALEQASATIRAAFAAGGMPPDMQAGIRAAYAELRVGPVAVRSSATTEDLPDLSFAGQQDTYLNVVGEEQLLAAVVNCWSSLWTARAIGYRLRNHISPVGAALAAVVQIMVPSEVSGVLFTANPLTGLLSESVIDATFGLGEALVSGQVEPDHFVVDSLSGQISRRSLGAKQIATRSKSGGGVETIAENAAARQTLSDDQIHPLVAIGQQIQREYNAPQDIEWALAEGKLYILQARAITSLFPVPRVSFNPLIVWVSFGAVQGLVGPMTPLGRDAIQHFVLGAGKLFGVTRQFDQVDVFVSAGERLWVKLSDVIRHPLGNRLARGMLSIVEPSVGQILVPLLDDPRLGAGKGRLELSTLWRLARFLLPVVAAAAHTLRKPEQARAEFDASFEDYLRAARIEPAADRFGRLAKITTFIQEYVATAFPFALPRFMALFGPGAACLAGLNRISGDTSLALELTRGLPRNVTTEMDLALWETAQAIRADAGAAKIFGQSEAPALARRYLEGTLPAAAQSAIARFMDRYGMRGVGEIDLGQPRWREDPTPTLHTLQSYLQIDPQFAPDAVFARGERAAHDALEKLAAQARRQRGGRFKEKLVRGAARRIWVLMGARESPKFFLIRMMGIARGALLEVGQEFVAAGTIDRAGDLVFLTLAELEAMSRQNQSDWKPIIAQRQAAFQRELQRRQVPRVLLSDGRAFYEGIGAATDTGEVITGSPVSAGVVEGLVHVVLDPQTARLAPGEILVCPGTDPAWTPLFLVAGGLITEVGGMMTHGSVVAREYGIPAVVGVDRATQRLKTGQRVRLDGTTGKIALLSALAPNYELPITPGTLSLPAP
jgi:phosphohistidine swiveling domain-containing protein